MMIIGSNMKFRQAIQIPDHITHGVFNLPCVVSAKKDRLYGFIYILLGDTQTDLFRWVDTIYAKPSDWLCEDNDGRWHLLSDEEYEKLNL